MANLRNASFSQDQVDEIALTIKRDMEDMWRMLLAGTSKEQFWPRGDDTEINPTDLVAHQYVGDPAPFLDAVRQLADQRKIDYGASVYRLAAEICRAVPRLKDNYDTWTEEEKALAIRTVREKLPEAWARIVRIQGGRALSDDDARWGANSQQIVRLLKELPVCWLEGSFDHASPKVYQLGILYGYVMTAARAAAESSDFQL